MIVAGMRSCAIAVHFHPCGFAQLWFAKLTPLFRRFIPLLLVAECSGVIAPCFFHLVAVSSAVMPPRHTSNSLESSVPPVSLAPVSTISATTNASIWPEFLASVIQAIQTSLSAIVQKLLSAVVSAHSVSQSFPIIAIQGSPLTTCAAHLNACGFNQP